MPELRKDPIVGRWVIISTDRGKRPSDFAPLVKSSFPKSCPFCPGNEALTPPEIMAVRPDGSAPNMPGWRLRVISNKYPALKIEGDLNREGEGMFDRMNGIGAHEVVIETEDHSQDLVDMDLDRISEVFLAYRSRMQDLRKDFRFKYIIAFKNHGEAAGASLEHAHSQIIATPVVPIRVQAEIDGGRKYYDFKDRCIFCDIIRQELNWSTRIVAENDQFIALEPFAPRFPFETWILPKSHFSSYLDITNSQADYLAQMIKTVLAKLRVALADPPYNYVLHTDALDNKAKDYFHWHIEVIPKLTKVAGFEWGTGFYINPVAPEDAAQYLRELSVT
jgi:UDPglucose--hexose-1-phosphate uridylyltransferase